MKKKKQGDDGNGTNGGKGRMKGDGSSYREGENIDVRGTPKGGGPGK
jgi:hypothetical protein